jgi:dethiobiotin synthetase
MKGYFVTGTDTGVGKTWISAALLSKYQQQGLSTAAMKPVASGCVQTAEGLRNDDALLLQQTASVGLDYDEINPFAFEPAIAPHLAAEQAAVEIDAAIIKQHFDMISDRADVVIVEGVGGWHVPITKQQTMVDVARILDLPVILVVGMRLGCLNHALLTAAAIENDGMQLAGWLANSAEADMPCLQGNIRSLKDTLQAAFLGHVPRQNTRNIKKISEYICLP